MTSCDHDLSIVAALIDGELDAVHAAEVEARIETCPACAEEYGRLRHLRAALRAEGTRAAAPERLRRRLARSLAEAAAPNTASIVPLPPRRARPLAWAGGGAGL